MVLQIMERLLQFYEMDICHHTTSCIKAFK